MAASTVAGFLTPQQYLRSPFEGDMDYVDGVLEDRNVGEWDHWTAQRALYEMLKSQEKTCGFTVAQEVRVQVSPTRLRVPDTCLIATGAKPIASFAKRRCFASRSFPRKIACRS